MKLYLAHLKSRFTNFKETLMNVVREESILKKIDKEIDNNTKPDIVRIDLNENEFSKFLYSLRDAGKVRPLLETSTNVVKKTSKVVLIDCHNDVGSFRIEGCHVFGKPTVKYKGSYIMYRDVCVQCFYEELGTV